LVRIRIIFVICLLVALTGIGAIPAHSAQRTVTLAAVGDVFFCRSVARQIELNGFDYPFEFTADILSRYDLAFCNLECALSTRGTPQSNRFLFRADPSAALALSAAGFDIVSLANNHTLDYGSETLRDTVEAVEGTGMISVGTRLTGSEDSGVRIIERNGLKIGFLALSDFDVPVEESPVGYPEVLLVDPNNLPRQVADTKSCCDVLVVSVHWGVDYMPFYTERQRAIGRMCIDNGADLVLGHHPHVLQDVEIYRGKPIVYSMGAFVWDSTHRGSDSSAIFVFELGPSSADLAETIPVEIVDSRPTLEE
jgi:poly-gamma-glutamate capsule biosynthesis protein CapA/YwtB (metallophosphatase superfamily)